MKNKFLAPLFNSLHHDMKYLPLLLLCFLALSCSDDSGLDLNQPIQTREISTGNCEISFNFDFEKTTQYYPLQGDFLELCEADIAQLQTQTKKKRVSVCGDQNGYCYEITGLFSSKLNEGYQNPYPLHTITHCDGIVSSTDSLVDDAIFDPEFFSELFTYFNLDTLQSQQLMDSLIIQAANSGNLISNPNSDIVGIMDSPFINGDVFTSYIDKVKRVMLGFLLVDSDGKIKIKTQLEHECVGGKMQLKSVIISKCILTPICKQEAIKRTFINLSNYSLNY